MEVPETSGKYRDWLEDEVSRFSNVSVNVAWRNNSVARFIQIWLGSVIRQQVFGRPHSSMKFAETLGDHPGNFIHIMLGLSRLSYQEAVVAVAVADSTKICGAGRPTSRKAVPVDGFCGKFGKVLARRVRIFPSSFQMSTVVCVESRRRRWLHQNLLGSKTNYPESCTRSGILGKLVEGIV